MYVVYWSVGERGQLHPHSKEFPSDQMKESLIFMEELRKRQRGGEPIGFITMCSEDPNVVGPAGVADPSADYNWKKRRR